MRLYAAIDLRDGAAVQLVGGEPGEERVRIPDPGAVARRWLEAGFRHLHVIDLDAALDQGRNDEALVVIAGTVGDRATLQVGGGIRDEAAVDRTLALGADRVIVGTRAVEDRPWLERVALRFPERVVVAADVRGREIVTRGWTETTSRDAVEFAAALDPLPLAGVLVTDVDREGRQAGIDTARFRAMAGATRHPVLAAGGVTTRTDIAALKRAGIAGAVLGMALYSGRLDPDEILEEETE